MLVVQSSLSVADDDNGGVRLVGVDGDPFECQANAFAEFGCE